MVVSVAPIIQEDIIPKLESTPNSFIMLVAIAVVVLPEIGLTNIKEIKLLSIPKMLNIGATILLIKSKIPEALSIPTATIKASKVGKNSYTNFNPCTAPSTKSSNKFLFSFSPYLNVISIKNIIAILLIYSIKISHIVKLTQTTLRKNAFDTLN